MKAPWHLWLIGILSLLWHSGGAFDYTMTKTQNVGYMSAFTPEQLDFFYNFPLWANVGWAIGVWFAVAGSFLLLLRSRLALGAFVLSLCGLAATTLYSFVLAETGMMEVVGSGSALFTAAIFAITVLMIAYTRAMKIRGVLV